MICVLECFEYLSILFRTLVVPFRYGLWYKNSKPVSVVRLHVLCDYRQLILSPKKLIPSTIDYISSAGMLGWSSTCVTARRPACSMLSKLSSMNLSSTATLALRPCLR